MTPPRVIIVNGGSSAGKSSIVRRMQDLFREPWLATSIDDFVASLPLELQQSADGFDISADGAVQIGETFTRLETAWMTGIAATARAGAPVIVDDVFLRAAASQAHWATTLSSVPMAWVAVHCDPLTAQRRESSRPDRQAGMAVKQAHAVHQDVSYDVEVDTTGTDAQECARVIISSLRLI